MATAAPGPPPPPGGVVIEHKKGEVNELKAALRNPALDRDPEKKRDVIKRVIAYMTLGIDVSKLFSEMIMASASKDHVVKKMVYLYITTYATANPELSLLAINTLQKDCRDEDPMTRGLALRSFTSLRLENTKEYLPSVVAAGLKDSSPYVRKTAVIACIKLHRLAPEALVQNDAVNTLYNMLRDRDALVVSNCVSALNEILQHEGGMAINKLIIHHLLNRIKEFNEWSQCVVLDMVARYKPETQQETFDIMNLLEERLKHSNSAVVLAATKVFLNLTQDMKAVHAQVYARLKAPMLTLMTGGVFEQGFVCLKHIALLTSRSPAVFSGDFKHFFCRYNDPVCVKVLKLEILTTIASVSNVQEIVEELSEYVTDTDNSVARGSVSAVGSMGVKVAEMAGIVIDALMKFVGYDISDVSAEAVICMQKLLRKYPVHADKIIAKMPDFLRTIDEPEAKKALLWMLAEYGHVIPEAPYLFEPLVEGFSEETSQAVRLELLATATKLFFRRPAEMQAMLGTLLEEAISDASFTDVHDRAMLYYRLLHYDVHKAAIILSRGGTVDGPYVEEAPSELADKIFEQFNTLAVIYGEPAERFVTDERALSSVNAAAAKAAAAKAAEIEAEVIGVAAPVAAAPAAADDDDDDDDDEEEEDAPAPAPAPAPKPRGPMDDLLGLLDDLPTMAPAMPTMAAAPALALSPMATLDAPTFQQQWGALPTSETWAAMGRPGVTNVLKDRLAMKHVKCMAFGAQGDVTKFYFYAVEATTSCLLLVELQVAASTGQASAIIKGAGNVAAIAPFSALLKAELMS